MVRIVLIAVVAVLIGLPIENVCAQQEGARRVPRLMVLGFHDDDWLPTSDTAHSRAAARIVDLARTRLTSELGSRASVIGRDATMSILELGGPFTWTPNDVWDYARMMRADAVFWLRVVTTDRAVRVTWVTFCDRPEVGERALTDRVTGANAEAVARSFAVAEAARIRRGTVCTRARPAG